MHNTKFMFPANSLNVITSSNDTINSWNIFPPFLYDYQCKTFRGEDMPTDVIRKQKAEWKLRTLSN